MKKILLIILMLHSSYLCPISSNDILLEEIKEAIRDACVNNSIDDYMNALYELNNINGISDAVKIAIVQGIQNDGFQLPLNLSFSGGFSEALPDVEGDLTFSNIGSGSKLLNAVSNINFEFKTLVAGDNIVINENESSVQISTSPTVGEANTASNLGGTTGQYGQVFAQKSGLDLQFRRIIPGTNMSVSQDANNITVVTSAEINTGSNLGSSGTGIAEVFKQKNGADFEFRRIYSNRLSLSQDANRIIIGGPTFSTSNGIGISFDADFGTYIIQAAAIVDSSTSLGAGTSILAADSVNSTGAKKLNFKSLVVSTNMDSSATTNDITLSNRGQLNTASSPSTTVGRVDVFKQKSSSDFQFRSLFDNNDTFIDVTLATNGNDIIVRGQYTTTTAAANLVGYEGGGTFRFYRIGKMVWMETPDMAANFFNVSAISSAIGFIPSGYRPRATTYFPMYKVQGTSGGGSLTYQIAYGFAATDGSLTFSLNPFEATDPTPFSGFAAFPCHVFTWITDDVMPALPTV